MLDMRFFEALAWGTGGRGVELFQVLGPRTLKVRGAPAQVAAELAVWNGLGGGVFVCVNPMRGDVKGIDELAALRTLFVDYDHGMPERWPADLEPTMVVQSSPGKGYAFWVLDEALEPCIENLTLWQLVENSLVAGSGGDWNARDASRILRVPGFANCKYPEKPCVQITQLSGKRYKLQTLAAALPLEPVAEISNPLPDVGEPGEKDLPPMRERNRRYKGWLAALEAPAAGNGERNGWYYMVAAGGLRDFALPERDVVDHLCDHTLHHHGVQAYDLDRLERIVRNAAKSARRPLGTAYDLPPLTIEL